MKPAGTGANASRASRLLMAGLLVLGSASSALADDCSGFSDCYDTMLAALLVILALLLLAALLWYFWPFIVGFLGRMALGQALRGLMGAAARSRIVGGAGRLLGHRVSDALRTHAARELARTGQNRVLGQLFGRGLQGARNSLANFHLPPNLTRQAVELYREIARHTIRSPRCTPAAAEVQRLRIELCNRALQELRRLGL